MKKVILIFIILSLVLVSCSSATKKEEMTPNSISHEEKLQEPMKTQPHEINQSSESTENQEAMIIQNREWPNDDEWMNETSILIKSEEDINKIQDLADQAIHAIVSVDSISSLQNALEIFDDIKSDVSTFEFKFTKSLNFTDNPIEIHAQNKRIIIAGDGTEVNLGRTEFDLRGSVIQVSNLQWSDGEADFPRLEISAKKYFEMKNVSFKEIKDTAYDNPDKAAIITIKPLEDDTPALIQLKDVQFDHNSSNALISLENRDSLAAMKFDHVSIINNNNFLFGIDISAKESVEISNCNIRGNKLSSAFVQKTPSALVTIKDSTLEDKVYRYEPLSKYKGVSAKKVILINNNISELPI